MFIDTARLTVSSGNGGNGAVSFRREKYIPAGGPDGGDGGKGGNVFVLADNALSTLADFRHKRKFSAENGADGTGSNRSGKGGADLTLRVPRGTLIRDAESGALLLDVSGDEPQLLMKGGRGGWGNAHFKTPTRQAPSFSKSGKPGVTAEVTFELKLLADVGLVGFPNAGKSSLLSVISAAKPKIGDYPFTTLSPVLGVVTKDEASCVVADIPGLIEGASSGAGLGAEFLRHIERCRLTVHITDLSPFAEREPIEAYEAINAELRSHSERLAGLPQIVCANKCDIWEDSEAFERFSEHVGGAVKISTATREGVDALIGKIFQKLAELPPIKVFEPEKSLIAEELPDDGEFTVTKDPDGAWNVGGEWLRRSLIDVRFDDDQGKAYLDRLLRKYGVFRELERRGLEDEDTVRIFNLEFMWKY